MAPSGEWPTADQFYDRAVSTLAPLPLEIPSHVSIHNLYKQLSHIHNRVARPSSYSCSAGACRVWPWVVRTPTTTMRFPTIKPRALHRTLLPSVASRSRHPVARHDIQPSRIIAIVSNLTSELHRWIAPVYLDIGFRVWWRLLPVHYLCWNAADPAARTCVLSCSAIETYEHLLYNCRVTRPVLDALANQCEPLFQRTPRWEDVLFGHRIPVKTVVPESGSLLLWHIIAVSVWRLRNDMKHRDQPPPPTDVIVARIQSLVRAHCRSARRIPDDDQILVEELLSAAQHAHIDV